MVPLKVSGYLGYIISFAGDKYLLRVKDGSAGLTDEAYVTKYAAELKPVEQPRRSLNHPLNPASRDKPCILLLMTARRRRLPSYWIS